MGSRNYIHAVPELFGAGDSKVCNTVLRDVAAYFPATERNYINLKNDF